MVKQVPWSKQVENMRKKMGSLDFKTMDRLAKVGALKLMVSFMHMSANGWMQWFHSDLMETFDDEEMEKLCNEMRGKVDDFLSMDGKYTKTVEDIMKEEQEKLQKKSKKTRGKTQYIH